MPSDPEIVMHVCDVCGNAFGVRAGVVSGTTCPGCLREPDPPPRAPEAPRRRPGLALAVLTIGGGLAMAYFAWKMLSAIR
jgi:hypothetical protein